MPAPSAWNHIHDTQPFNRKECRDHKERSVVDGSEVRSQPPSRHISRQSWHPKPVPLLTQRATRPPGQEDPASNHGGPVARFLEVGKMVWADQVSIEVRFWEILKSVIENRSSEISDFRCPICQMSLSLGTVFTMLSWPGPEICLAVARSLWNIRFAGQCPERISGGRSRARRSPALWIGRRGRGR